MNLLNSVTLVGGSIALMAAILVGSGEIYTFFADYIYSYPIGMSVCHTICLYSI